MRVMYVRINLVTQVVEILSREWIRRYCVALSSVYV